MNRVADERMVVALVKNGQRWVVLYDESTKAAALRQLGRWAADKRLAFNWYDAAVLAGKIQG